VRIGEQGARPVLQKLLDVLPLNDERRRFQRVRVNLLGRYMLADRREFPCQVVDMSPGDIAVEAPVTGEPGQRVVAYIVKIGTRSLGQCQITAHRGNMDDCSVRAFALKPRAFGAPLGGVGA
jgi:hypothetical protein